MHCHSFCCLPYQYPSESALTLTYIYRICDGVVTLSKCDERIVSAFSEYTKCIANPITFSETLPAAADVSKEENALVWVGRISVEKQPFDAVTMMSYVIKEIPNAKLYMVGAGESEMFKHLQDSIYESDLQNNVILTGFTKDVETYYQKANICVSTSEYEGFSLTFCEAMSHELPIVSYDMPWLIFMQDGRGIIPVQQKRVDILAKEVVRLLKDPNEITRLGKEGKQQIEDMKKINIADSCLAVLKIVHNTAIVKINGHIVLNGDVFKKSQYITEHCQSGINGQQHKTTVCSRVHSSNAIARFPFEYHGKSTGNFFCFNQFN